MSRPSCLAEVDLLAAAMGESGTALTREHLAVCASCARRLRRVTAEVAALRRGRAAGVAAVKSPRHSGERG